MTTASTTFTIVANTVSQADNAPNVGVNTGGAGFNYPTYVPVQVPAAVPSKEARITNVSMPSIVLPNATFNIIVTFQTFVTQVNNYVCHLTIPQLSLDHTSNPVSLANLARGSTIFTITLPIQPPEQAENSSGIITGQIDLVNTSGNLTDDGTPISFRVQAPGDVTVSPDHHDNSIPPVLIPPVLGGTDTGGTVVILSNSDPTGDLDLDVHGFIPFEPVDLDLAIPMVNKSDHENKTADKDGHFTHHYHFTKDASKQYVGSVKCTGHNSKKTQSKTVNI
jgi:hypothetical protein